MLDLKKIEDEDYLKVYRKSLKDQKGDELVLDRVIALNLKRKQEIANVENRKAQQKKMGEEIFKKKKTGGDASAEMAEVQQLKEAIKNFETILDGIQQELGEKMLHLPNLSHSSVPAGASEEDNQVLRTVGDPIEFSFEAKDHLDLAENLGIIDTERAAKVAGSRFVFLMGWAAKLERALANFMLDLHTEVHGYREVLPPYLVNAESMVSTGQFPKFNEEVFHIKGHPLYLIPTAETPMTSLYRDEILKAEDLPQKFAAYSSCFRSEAGSYGRDTRGLIRQHQFEKVELMSFVHPDRSEEEHTELTSHAEEVLKRLELPYRVSLLCTGDLSFSASKCFDLEVWLPSSRSYREISSCSNFGDFQARRANIRFRPGGKAKPQFVHTLNGSGLAIGRTLIAILENYQEEDGSIRVPQALKKYLGVDRITR